MANRDRDTRSLHIRKRVRGGEITPHQAMGELAGTVPNYEETSTFHWLHRRMARATDGAPAPLENQSKETSPEPGQCQAMSKKTGNQCKKKQISGSDYCRQHDPESKKRA